MNDNCKSEYNNNRTQLNFLAKIKIERVLEPSEIKIKEECVKDEKNITMEAFPTLKHVKEEKIEEVNSSLGNNRFFKIEPIIVKDEKPDLRLISKGKPKKKKPRQSEMVACPVCKIECKYKNLKKHKRRKHSKPGLVPKQAKSIKKEGCKIVRKKITSSSQLRLKGRKNSGSSKLMPMSRMPFIYKHRLTPSGFIEDYMNGSLILNLNNLYSDPWYSINAFKRQLNSLTSKVKRKKGMPKVKTEIFHYVKCEKTNS